MDKESITERAQVVLKLLIETYILKGQPVGSQFLAKNSPLMVSSATVRNILSELEDMGLLTSPHTSSGRVPTQEGFRFFVNCLLKVKDIDEQVLTRCNNELQLANLGGQLMHKASNLLADVTQLTGMVSLPQSGRAVLRHIEFLSLSEGRVLVILVLNKDEVQNRIVECGLNLSGSELEQMGHYLCEQFVGLDLHKIQALMLAELKTDHERVHNLMQTAIAVAGQAIRDNDSKQDYVVSGQQHLLNLADEGGIDNLRNVFNAFTEKQKILSLFEKCMQAEGVQIFIGQEAGLQDFAKCSVVAAPYKIEGQAVGVLGVVGPTRMAYQQVIPIVDITAKILSSALN